MPNSSRASRAGKKALTKAHNANHTLIGVDSMPFDALQGWESAGWMPQSFEESSAHCAVITANKASAKVVSHSVGQAWAYIRQQLPRS